MPNQQCQHIYHLKNALVYTFFADSEQHNIVLTNTITQQQFTNCHEKGKFNAQKIYEDIDNLIHTNDLSKEVYVTPRKCSQLLEFYLENYQKIQSKTEGNGLKLIIDDDGNIIFANWKNKKISGKYFIYLNKLPSQSFCTNLLLNNGICYFGQMKQQKLQGWNYIYGSNNIKLAAEWKQNKLNGRCIIKQKKKNKTDEINLHEHQTQQLTFRNFSYQNANYGYIFSQNHLVLSQRAENQQSQSKSNIFRAGLLQNIKNNDKKALKIISNCPSANLTAIQFITKMIQEHQNMFIDEENILNYSSQKYQDNQNKPILNSKISIGIKRIDQNQFYIGTLTENINQKYEKSGFVKNSHDQNLLSINGLGFVLKNDWPYRFGQFKNGKLHGVGKILQNQLNILDGYFQNDKLKEGFIIDLYSNKMKLGYHSNNQNKSLDYLQEQKTILQIKKLQINKILPLNLKTNTLYHPIINQRFNIVHTYQSVDFQEISKFRKIMHLKALNLYNDYQSLPLICKSLPWPQFLLRKIYNTDTITQIIHNFAPQIQNVDISIITGVPQNSDHRFERNMVNMLNEQIQDEQNEKICSGFSSSNQQNFCKRQNEIKIEQFKKQYQQLQQNKVNIFEAQKQRKNLNNMIKQIATQNLAKSRLIESNVKYDSIKQQNSLKGGTFYNWISQLQNIQTQRLNLPVKKRNQSNFKQQNHLISQLFIKQKQKSLPIQNKKIINKKTAKKRLDLHQIYSKYLH